MIKVTQSSLHVLSLIISQSFVALLLLLGVEDTAGVQQQRKKDKRTGETMKIG